MGVRIGWLVFAGVVACGDNVRPPSVIHGSVFSDDNHNGIHDPGEVGFEGVQVYVNLDADPTINGNDPATRTAADGTFTLPIPGPGTYEVREVLPFGVRASSRQAKRILGTPHHRIIGGADTSAGDYNFMVSVGQPFQDILFPFCGGALITDRLVVTAAHCSVGTDPNDVAVAAGTLDPFAGGEIVEVESIAVHPSFNDVNAGFDIAVWKLKEPIDLEGSGLNTIELLTPETAALADAGVLATTLGWGASDRASSLLQEVHLPVVDAGECAAAYPESTHFDTQICAGVPEGGIDSCQGDSGGPLIVRDDARQVWVQAGITSYGEGCALPDFPGVYARVSAISDFALAQATESSEPIMVTVEPGEDGIADFANESSIRPQVGEITPRWQLTGVSDLPETIPANTATTMRWRIIDDGSGLTGFTCSFAGDIAAGTPAQTASCQLGDNQLALTGFPNGIFATALTVSRDGVEFQRHVNVFAGSPSKTTTNAALEAQDGLDPDYNDPYHIDYYDVTALAGTKVFAIEAESDDFGMFLTLYDADERDFVNGGGLLQFAEQIDGSTQRLIVVPEPGKRYLVGISSFDVAEIGTYKVSILNDGVITAH